MSFSIELTDDTIINFLASTEEVANYWTDAIYMLVGSNNRSKTYERELEVLVDMDLHLRLLELQNYKLPMKPPVVPSDPLELPEM